ncbi:MAG: hypothetical protein PUP93_02220 [Rhizonema sp. NSF051]|nr:hypothetical protein [Rhizonema sp. NSF051]
MQLNDHAQPLAMFSGIFARVKLLFHLKTIVPTESIPRAIVPELQKLVQQSAGIEAGVDFIQVSNNRHQIAPNNPEDASSAPSQLSGSSVNVLLGVCKYDYNMFQNYAQAQIRAAYTKANVAPNTISYIEAHGTGRSLRELIEINRIKRAFRQLHQQYNLSLVNHLYCRQSQEKFSREGLV